MPKAKPVLLQPMNFDEAMKALIKAGHKLEQKQAVSKKKEAAQAHAVPASPLIYSSP